MTGTMDRTSDMLEQLPIRGLDAAGEESLPLARTLLENAVSAIKREPNRMGAWRLVGATLEARKAFKTHVSLCSSPHGPLARAASQGPELAARSGVLLSEHRELMACLDDLITMANREKGATPAAARALCAMAEGCTVAIDGYERRYRELIFAAPERPARQRRAG